MGNKATTYTHTNTTILDAEILTQIFPGSPQFQLSQSHVTQFVTDCMNFKIYHLGAKYLFVTSDPKRHIYNSFFHTTILEKERKDTRKSFLNYGPV